MQEWINVGDRLPKKKDLRAKGQVLAIRENGDYVSAFFRNRHFTTGYRSWNDITHWMSLPEPPIGAS